ncbi:MAG: peptidoglycan DD-metalloendopeptidase family protein [Lachnoclostridium sp.]|nr:peptidoglycan DD-metalloendopeptidase family protein [Lachnospira sp.]MCM1248826.1 peptidoglycan DD-metalloendopeptidase family protein [Lachnoclostridium sp.]MCM1535478.1 peptidoglycan DD-metalloendopeptidase family protein [Clostridium sp.]
MSRKTESRTEQNRQKSRAALTVIGAVLIGVLTVVSAEVLKGALEPLRVSALNISSITSDSIREKEDQIAQAQKEQKDLEKGITDLKKIKKELEAERSNLKNYIVKLDANLADIEANIADLNDKISLKEGEISRTQAELDEALTREENQKDYMTKRIRMMYEQGETYNLELLLEASSFSDFLNKADFVQKIMLYDQKVWEDYKRNRQYIELCKEELEIEKVTLDLSKEKVQEEQRSVEDLINQKTQDILSYESDINNKEKAIKEYEDDLAEQKEIIEALEAAVAEEKRRIIESSGAVLTYDGGQFKFPLATYTRISSEFGNRPDPILGIEKFHSGVDFAAPKGTAIYAAYDGVVVAATYSASMGNYVMIDHGDGLYTIYMHASALYVSKDDIVFKGDTIAAVGSTGRSTGNHLHFSVRKDGAYVSPWNYLSQ